MDQRKVRTGSQNIETVVIPKNVKAISAQSALFAPHFCALRVASHFARFSTSPITVMLLLLRACCWYGWPASCLGS